jgi:hypothetical protein
MHTIPALKWHKSEHIFKENKTRNNSTAIAINNFYYFPTLKLVLFYERACNSPNGKCPIVNIFSKQNVKVNKKDQAVPVNAMTAHKGSSSIFNLATTWK